jgi:hypothetical protein
MFPSAASWPSPLFRASTHSWFCFFALPGIDGHAGAARQLGLEHATREQYDSALISAEQVSAARDG